MALSDQIRDLLEELNVCVRQARGPIVYLVCMYLLVHLIKEDK